MISTLPYLQQATQSSPQLYTSGQNWQIQPPQQYKSTEQVVLDYQNAIEQARQQMVAGRGSSQLPFQVSDLRQGWMGNGNPESQGGVATVNLNGQAVRVPNAILQQLMYQDSWNQGRSNAVADYFGANQRAPAGMGYSSKDASTQAMDRYINSNPQLMQEGSLDPYKRAQNAAIQAGDEYRQLQAPKTMTETRSINGDVTGGTFAENQRAIALAKQKMDQASQAYQFMDNRGSRVRGSEQATAQLDSMMRNAPRIQRTYSNLPITERLV